MNVRRKPPTVVDLADEVAREVDDVGREVAERPRAGGRAVEAPDLGGRVAPVLQVAAAEVTELAELAGVDQLAREAHGRDEAVVERAQVLDAGRRDAAPDLVALVGVAPERLLADDVLARFRRGDRRRGMHAFGPRLSRSPIAGSDDEVLPVASSSARSRSALAASRDRLLVPPRDRHEPRLERRRPRHVARSCGRRSSAPCP